VSAAIDPCPTCYEDEYWAPIPSCSGYEASTHGQIRGVDRVLVNRDGQARAWRGRIMSQHEGDEYGHRKSRVGEYGYLFVHRMVLEAFRGPCPEGLEGCHNDGNAAHNHIGNLRWGTRSSNIRDVMAHGHHWPTLTIACPLGHELREPNLRSYHVMSGKRGCLACSRARARLQYYARKGVELDLRVVADAYYQEIMVDALAANRDRP
jgi:hypothetical protein